MPTYLTKSHILTNVPIFQPNQKVRQAKLILEKNNKWDSVNYVYLLDKKKHLKGILSVKELLAAPNDARLITRAHKNPVSVRRNTSVERVATLAIHHNVKSMPVVDKRGNFLGVVGTDQIFDVLNKAGLEDSIRYSGIHLENRGLLDVLRERIPNLSRRRLPWLLVGLTGAITASLFVGRFEHLLREVIELAFFTPAVVYMGSAAGQQTQALFLRAITIGEVRVSKFVFKEMAAGSLIGLLIGVISFVAIFLLFRDIIVALIVSLSMTLVILVASPLAVGITAILAKKRDPALGAGPFGTIIQDITSLIVYFTVASVVINFFG